MQLLHSAHGLPFVAGVNAWLNANVGLISTVISGHHAPYFDTPDAFTEEIRPLLQAMATTPELARRATGR